jgi:hypothetical protein
VIVVTWLKRRNGRKARLKIGNIEAEAQTVEEVERLIKQAEEFQKSKQKDRGP